MVSFKRALSVIAIDGPAASGKGTLCKRLADIFGFDLLDTGLLYRGVAWQAHCAGLDLCDEAKISEFVISLSHIDTTLSVLRSEEVGSMASCVAGYPKLRDALYQYQRCFAEDPPHKKGAILDGRDIGTVIYPETPYKLYLEASREVRAKRRYDETINRGESIEFSAILNDVIQRDAQDKNRKIAPLMAALDAIVIDTSLLDADQVLTIAVSELKKKGLG